MHLNLGKPYENYIQQQVDSGLYGNATEVVRDALRHMKEHEEEKRLDTLRALLAVGEEQLARGEGISYTHNFMDNAMKKAIENSNAGKPVRDEIKPQKN
jgi:antitoxin ParD1/3/4